MMTVGVNGAWAETINFNLPNGYYYIGNEAGANGVPEYDSSNFEANFYMCPASGTVNEQNYLGSDESKPLITTLKSFEAKGKTYSYAVWYIEAATGDNAGYFYIKHRDTGKYMVANDNTVPAATRRRVNLGPTSNPGNDGLFRIQSDDNGITYYISSKTKSSGNNKYLTPSNGNKDYLNATSSNDDTGGIIGFYTAKNLNSAWHFVQVKCSTPTISGDSNGLITITCSEPAEGATIYYSTDGITIPSSSTQYEEPFMVADQTTIKAIATKSGYVDSEMASSKLVLHATVTLAENEYTYDGSAKEPAVSSVKDGETVISSDEYRIEYQDNVNAGSASVLVKNKTGGNYIVYGSATFTINPKALTITADALSKAYGDDDPVLTYTSQGLVGSDAITGALSRDAGENVGTYAIRQNTLTAGNNYSISYTGANLTITPKALTVTAKPKTITYGDGPANDGVTYSAFAPSEDESVLSGTLAYAYNYAQYGNAGNYTITPCGLTGANYDITFVAGTLTVAQKEVALTWSEMTTFPYDGSAHAPTATVTGMLNSDAIAVTVTGAQTNAGDYTATALELTGTKSDNYKLPANHTREFSITRIGLTVTANNNAITYGDAPVGNGVTYEGFVNNETASVLGGTLDYDYSYTQFGDVGNTYTIIPKGLTSDNYDISFVAGTLTVVQKEVGITWGETTSFVYDGSAHAPTAGATGLVNDDAVTVFVTGAQANVGEYIATASSLIGNKAGNYKILGVNEQSFTISPKSIGDGTLADGYTLDFGEGNAILLTDDVIGRALVDPTDYSVGEDTNPSAQYFERTVTGIGNYTGSFNVRNVFIAFTTDTNQEEWSATFIAEKADESDIGLALPEGIGAFIISGIRGDWAIPEPLSYIPEGVPVLLVAHKLTYGFVATRAENGEVTPITPDQKGRNMLEEVSADTPGYNADTESAPFTTKQIYVLYKNEFVFNKAGSMKKGKVYLNPNHTAPAPGYTPARLTIAWNYTTGIQHPMDGSIAKTKDDVWYTIDGRRLSGKPNVKGFYIVGGKKIVIK